MTRHAIDAPQFYLTAPSPCPYLPGRAERKVFTHLVGSDAPALNDALTQGGFRRSQNIAYRPVCEGCRACISVRVLADRFRETKAFRRVWRRNDDVLAVELPPAPSAEQYSLFRRYLDDRHAEGGMADMTVLDYAMMVEDSHVNTMLIEYRRRDIDSAVTGRSREPAMGFALTDILNDGLSMVYSFFDPEIADRSLGTYMILDHIRRAQSRGLPYVYLGYWVKGSRKMDYKTRFRPQEQLLPQGWTRIE